MEISINPTENGLLFSLSGRLDTLTAPRLQEALAGLSPDVKSLRFDLSGLEYISSAGLRALLSAYKKLNGAVTLTGLNEICREVFTVTGFTEVFSIE